MERWGGDVFVLTDYRFYDFFLLHSIPIVPLSWSADCGGGFFLAVEFSGVEQSVVWQEHVIYRHSHAHTH